MDVLGPHELGRIARAADDEAALLQAARRLDQQALDGGLAIGGVGPEVRGVGGEARVAGRGAMHRRIDRAVERGDRARAEPLGQFVERGSAGVAEDEVEVGESVGRQVLDGLTAGEALERDRRVEIVEDAHRRRQRQLARGDGVGAVGGDDGGVAIVDGARGVGEDVVPVAVEDERGAVEAAEVAVRGVPGRVALEEGDLVAAAGERADEAAPQRRVPVAPRRAHREPEDAEPHVIVVGTLSAPPTGRAWQSGLGRCRVRMRANRGARSYRQNASVRRFDSAYWMGRPWRTRYTRQCAGRTRPRPGVHGPGGSRIASAPPARSASRSASSRESREPICFVARIRAVRAQSSRFCMRLPRALDEVRHRGCVHALHRLLYRALLAVGGRVGRTEGSVDRGDGCELARLASEVVEELTPLGEHDAVALTLEQRSHARVAGSARGLRRALVNVVQNAIEHSPHGHLVQVRVLADGPYGIVDVHDDGPGVPPPLRELVFEAFYSTRGAPGLGLAVTQSVVHACGGRVRFLDSSGCTVRIELPRLSPSSPDAAVEP